MKQILFTQSSCNYDYLYPFSLTRRVQDMRVGALTLREKWETLLNIPSYDLADDHFLSEILPVISLKKMDSNTVKYLIPVNLLPNKELVSKIKKMKPGQVITGANNNVLVTCINGNNFKQTSLKEYARVQDYTFIQFSWQIVHANKQALLYDFEILKKEKKSCSIDKSNRYINSKNIFIEKGANVRHSIINAEDGPVFIAKNALVMEGSCLRGPLYIGEGAVVKMGATIYGATTIGPGCTVGGEIKNSILFANSNKAHDGYLGDSVIGEWCNMGAGTSCSNMKNNIGEISYSFGDTHVASGQKKAGVMMGDYSRTAINTSINTGTVVGVSAHVFGTGLTPKIIGNFSWGFGEDVNKDLKKYDLEKALRDANAWKHLKGGQLSDIEKNILTTIYKQTK